MFFVRVVNRVLIFVQPNVLTQGLPEPEARCFLTTPVDTCSPLHPPTHMSTHTHRQAAWQRCS